VRVRRLGLDVVPARGGSAETSPRFGAIRLRDAAQRSGHRLEFGFAEVLDRPNDLFAGERFGGTGREQQASEESGNSPPLPQNARTHGRYSIALHRRINTETPRWFRVARVAGCSNVEQAFGPQ
jgi:hypothetical protein